MATELKAKTLRYEITGIAVRFKNRTLFVLTFKKKVDRPKSHTTSVYGFTNYYATIYLWVNYKTGSNIKFILISNYQYNMRVIDAKQKKHCKIKWIIMYYFNKFRKKLKILIL